MNPCFCEDENFRGVGSISLTTIQTCELSISDRIVNNKTEIYIKKNKSLLKSR